MLRLPKEEATGANFMECEKIISYYSFEGTLFVEKEKKKKNYGFAFRKSFKYIFLRIFGQFLVDTCLFLDTCILA